MDQPNSKTKPSEATRHAKQNVGAVSWRVCVVEDSYTTLPTIFKALKTRGHEADQFSTGNDAYRALSFTHYDAIIVGQAISTGTLDHQALIRKIRDDASAQIHDLPVVALSLSSNPAFEAALRSAGADVVLKELSSQNVYDAVVNAISTDRAPTPSLTASLLPKVCLLEDSYARSLTLSNLIAHQGYDVDHVTGQEEALQTLAANSYEVFLIGQTGSSSTFNLADCVRRARAISADHNYPLHIAIVSTATTTQHIASMMRLGVDSVVIKDKTGSYAASLARTLVSLSEPVSAVAPLPVMQTELPMSMPPPPQPTPAQPQRRPAFISSLSVLLGVGLLAGLWASWFAFGEAKPVEVIAALNGQLTKSVNGIGRVVGKRQVDLTSKHQGALYKVHTQEGDRVKAGEVLAILDNREALINVKRAEATIFRIRTDVEQAEKSVAAMRRMPPGSGVSSQVIGDLHSTVASGQASLRVAEQEAAAARLAVEQLNIVAPFSGVIMQSFAVEGRWVESSTALFTLVDTDVREAAILIDQQDARDVAAGQSVAISDGDNGQEWREKILRVANEPASPERTGAHRVVTAYSSLGPSAQSLPIGSRVFAQIVTESSVNTIKVPYETVFTQNGQDYVAVVADEHIRYRPVRVGIRALTEVEIVDGLALGDLVVLPRDTLTEGQRVATSSIITRVPLDDEGYPGRVKYSDVPVYSTEQLRKHYDTVLIVDVRSKFEFDVIHIEKAFNVPVSSSTFLQDLEQLRLADASVPLVFYCNGHSCMKSYEAVRKAVAGGFQNVYAYDSGIFDWLRDSRERTTLLGDTPAPLDKMVSEEFFQGRLLDFASFKKKATARNTVVIDVRDVAQREDSFSLEAIEIPLDEFVAKLDQNEFKGKQLLLFDAVGKQVRWLQYILEDRGYKDYFFLKDGIASPKN